MTYHTLLTVVILAACASVASVLTDEDRALEVREAQLCLDRCVCVNLALMPAQYFIRVLGCNNQHSSLAGFDACIRQAALDSEADGVISKDELMQYVTIIVDTGVNDEVMSAEDVCSHLKCSNGTAILEEVKEVIHHGWVEVVQRTLRMPEVQYGAWCGLVFLAAFVTFPHGLQKTLAMMALAAGIPAIILITSALTSELVALTRQLRWVAMSCVSIAAVILVVTLARQLLAVRATRHHCDVAISGGQFPDAPGEVVDQPPRPRRKSNMQAGERARHPRKRGAPAAPATPAPSRPVRSTRTRPGRGA